MAKQVYWLSDAEWRRIVPLLPGAQMIASVTFIAILMTTLIQAPTTRWLAKGVGLLRAADGEPV